MSQSMLIRDVPPEIRGWIDAEREARRMSQREFVISVLAKVYKSRSAPSLFDELPKPIQPISKGLPFKFIDLFAGIGGFRLALNKLGGVCVFTSEWDKFSQKTYAKWFGEMPTGDINEVDPDSIPDHDILAAGFPCQPFSIAGVSKKRSLGQADGFRCERQGNLFFKICNIIDTKRPPVLMLENVKNLRSHDKGRTWEIIKSELEHRGYLVFSEIIDACYWVPQHRERLFIVCFDRDVFGESVDFEYPDVSKRSKPKFREILEDNPDDKYILTNHLWNYLQRYAEKHRAQGNGFGFGLTDLDGISRTISARYYKDGSEILIPRGKGRNPRRLTIVEAARLMGFGEIVSTREDVPVSDTQAYRQFGNAVVPAVVEAVGEKVLAAMSAHLRATANGCFLKGRPVAQLPSEKQFTGTSKTKRPAHSRRTSSKGGRSEKAGALLGA